MGLFVLCAACVCAGCVRRGPAVRGGDEDSEADVGRVGGWADWWTGRAFWLGRIGQDGVSAEYGTM